MSTLCPRCKNTLIEDGQDLICPNPSCPYRCIKPVKLPTYDELLKENEELKKKQLEITTHATALLDELDEFVNGGLAQFEKDK